jgi:hypothetical protein
LSLNKNKNLLVVFERNSPPLQVISFIVLTARLLTRIYLQSSLTIAICR